MGMRGVLKPLQLDHKTNAPQRAPETVLIQVQLAKKENTPLQHEPYVNGVTLTEQNLS